MAVKSLLLGCDYFTLHNYWRYFCQYKESQICGIVYCVPGDLHNFSKIKFRGKTDIPIYRLEDLERVISDQRIQKCILQVSKLPHSTVTAILHRIISTGISEIEFPPPAVMSIHSNKPIITLNSIARKLGKSLLAAFFCASLTKVGRRVGIIMPFADINFDDLQSEENESYIDVNRQGLNFEYGPRDRIPSNLFSPDDTEQIKNYQASGAYRIYATSDVRKALIKAEQRSDVIIIDARTSDITFAHTENRFCVVNGETLHDIHNLCLWPGLINIFNSQNIVEVEMADQLIESNSLNQLQISQNKSSENINEKSVMNSEKSVKNTEKSDNNENTSFDFNFLYGDENTSITTATNTEKTNATDTEKTNATDTEKSNATDTEKSNATNTEKTNATDTEKTTATNTEKTNATDTEKTNATNTEKTNTEQTKKANDPQRVTIQIHNDKHFKRLKKLNEELPQELTAIIKDGSKEIRKFSIKGEFLTPLEIEFFRNICSNMYFCIGQSLDDSNNSITEEIQNKDDIILANEIISQQASYKEIVILSLQRDINLLHNYNIRDISVPKIYDCGHELLKFLWPFFPTLREPPLKKHFQAQVDILMAFEHTSSEEINCSNHSSMNRYAFCQLFLLSHIPPGFRVTSGEIVDSYHNFTSQLNVIIVNDDCPTMTIDSSGDVVAPIIADSVLCVMDVKPELNGEHLKKSIEKLRPVKGLMPIHETLVNQKGDVIEDPLEGSILTGFLGFAQKNNMIKPLEMILPLLDSAPGVLDFVVSATSFGIFSARVLSVCGIDISAERIEKGYVIYTSKGKGLAMIFGILNAIASRRRFSGSNYINYLKGKWLSETLDLEETSLVNDNTTYWKTNTNKDNIDQLNPDNINDEGVNIDNDNQFDANDFVPDDNDTNDNDDEYDDYDDYDDDYDDDYNDNNSDDNNNNDMNNDMNNNISSNTNTNIINNNITSNTMNNNITKNTMNNNITSNNQNNNNDPDGFFSSILNTNNVKDFPFNN